MLTTTAVETQAPNGTRYGRGHPSQAREPGNRVIGRRAEEGDATNEPPVPDWGMEAQAESFQNGSAIMVICASR
jgi:hypothetical protein